MNTVKTCTVHSKSYEDTLRIGYEIAKNLRGGEVIELVGDLGSGKTALTRGIHAGLMGKDVVSSPSFALHNEYETPTLGIDHLDFYRLDEAGIMSDEIAELLCQQGRVVIIEWGDVVADILPKNRLKVAYTITGDTERTLQFSYAADCEYIIRGLKA